MKKLLQTLLAIFLVAPTIHAENYNLEKFTQKAGDLYCDTLSDIIHDVDQNELRLYNVLCNKELLFTGHELQEEGADALIIQINSLLNSWRFLVLKLKNNRTFRQAIIASNQIQLLHAKLNIEFNNYRGNRESILKWSNLLTKGNTLNDNLRKKR